MKELNVGVIGLGMRGSDMLMHVINIPGVKVTALCDLYSDRIEKASDSIYNEKGYRPGLTTTDYNELIESDNVEVVMVFAAWEAHIPAAIASMKNKKPVAVEVAGAYSIQQCWDLVKTYEETNTPIMMLENCCYGRTEMMLKNMINQGVFGTLVHFDGAYCHDLRREVSGGIKNRHYRLRNYKNRNCDNYPTHELGPIAQMLEINRGNRLLSLTSTASKGVGLKEYIKEKHSDDEYLCSLDFAQGDVITTTIKCAHGETITIVLDTTLPRYYTRNLCVHGTKALYDDRVEAFYIDGEVGVEHEWNFKGCWGNIEKYREKYEHPVWKKYLDEGVKSGHGGMDWLVLNAFFDSLRANAPMPIDVYDMATWMAITPLTEKSISLGSMPVEIPDFTNGKWHKE